MNRNCRSDQRLRSAYDTELRPVRQVRRIAPCPNWRKIIRGETGQIGVRSTTILRRSTTPGTGSKSTGWHSELPGSCNDFEAIVTVDQRTDGCWGLTMVELASLGNGRETIVRCSSRNRLWDARHKIYRMRLYRSLLGRRRRRCTALSPTKNAQGFDRTTERAAEWMRCHLQSPFCAMEQNTTTLEQSVEMGPRFIVGLQRTQSDNAKSFFGCSRNRASMVCETFHSQRIFDRFPLCSLPNCFPTSNLSPASVSTPRWRFRSPTAAGTSRSLFTSGAASMMGRECLSPRHCTAMNSTGPEQSDISSPTLRGNFIRER
ncbi:hypothetical protein RBWH47_00357 [Rhodopirellula baltica WH47]|uniref:Uncharacterized protein n=1 Tax=Rhodopirellula baltica WH47 TaxID=991778 RepID=F2AUG5_RHOBT|nr:hypothetical protein RBWH47_00357 [Rhodopirellula baltica WH47]